MAQHHSHDDLADRRAAAAPYVGSRVVDAHHRWIGKVRDVVCDERGVPRWAVVRLGLFQPEHYVPLDNVWLTLEGELVVPFDRRTVTRSPRAEPARALSPSAELVVEQYYRLAS